MGAVREIGDQQVLYIGPHDPIGRSERDTNDLIGEARAAGVQVIMVPSAHLSSDFYELRTGLAGASAQKAVNYRMLLAVVGNIDAYLARSNALRDWVRETNYGDTLWLLPTVAELAERLAGRRDVSHRLSRR